ncbi:unnamed protein product [Gadus morhua 'NCC']
MLKVCTYFTIRTHIQMLYHFVPFCAVLYRFVLLFLRPWFSHFCKDGTSSSPSNKAESPGGFSPDGGRFQQRAKPNLRPKPLSDTFQKKEMSQDRLKAFKGALLQAFKTKHSQSVAVAELLGLVNKDPTPA